VRPGRAGTLNRDNVVIFERQEKLDNPGKNLYNPAGVEAGSHGEAAPSEGTEPADIGRQKPGDQP
jgi:hypothetical protein